MWGNAVIQQLLKALQARGMQQPQSQPQRAGSAGLFDQYMQNGMIPRYQPPSIPGIFGTQPGGYRGFFAPQMPKLTQPAPMAQGPQGNVQGLPWDQYFGRGDAAGP